MTLGVLRRPSLLRGVLAGVVVVDLISFFFFLGDARVAAAANGVAITAFGEVLSAIPVRSVVVVIGVAGAVLFGRAPGRLWAGLVPLGALTLLSTAHAQLFGSPWRHLYYSGLCLSGWLAGLAVSRWRGLPTDESYARVGSTALLGAAYFNAGISKLVFGGWDWVWGLPIRAVVVAQDGLVADSAISVYRSWVVATPMVAGLFSVATLVCELAGPLMIGEGKTRRGAALGLLAMHLNILVLTHILYWEAMVFLVLFGLLPRQPLGEAVDASRSGPLFSDRAFVAGAALLVVCALLGISHQSRRFTQSQMMRALQQGPVAQEPVAQGPVAAAPASSEPAPTPLQLANAPAEPAPAAPAPLRRLGPFTVGETLTPGWSVETLEITGDGFTAVLSGKPGHASFEVICSAAEQRKSPFDLDAARILYGNNLAFPELRAVGWAFRTRIQSAAEGSDVCGRVADWRTAARSTQTP